MCACASSSWMIETAEPKLFSAGACAAARRYAGAETSSVSADTVRMRRMPFRYSGRHVLQTLDQLAGGEMRAHLVLGARRELLDGGHQALSSNVRHHVDERERIV